MEEVWKDINLASLSDFTPNPYRSSSSSSPLLHIDLPHQHNHRRHQSFRNTTLQDFLARPFARTNDSPARLASSATADTRSPASPLTPTPPPPPPTLLSLNHPTAAAFSDQRHLFYVSDTLNRHSSSALIDHHHHHNLHHHPNPTAISNHLSGYPFESSPALPSSGKRTCPDSDNSNSGGDRRHKRMIKNRESAARSRARKQAYTNELELEVAHLMEENAKLKRQQEQLCYAATTQQPKRHSLSRSPTAPF